MVSNPSKLGKVLALADSAHEGEALTAVRTAQAMLRGSGVELSEILIHALAKGTKASALRGAGNAQLEALYLRHQLKERDRELAKTRQELETARAAFAHSEKERTRWEKVAKETMDKYWALAAKIAADKTGT
jgi:flagellar biosynthesis chaperone FliJ